MNIIHDSRDSEYRTPFGAAETGADERIKQAERMIEAFAECAGEDHERAPILGDHLQGELRVRFIFFRRKTFVRDMGIFYP